jgi:hypothetical protein
MTFTIQPGQKECSIAGRLAVHFKGIILPLFVSEDRGAASPSEPLARYRMNLLAPVRLCLAAAFALLLAGVPAWTQERKQLAPEAPPQRVEPRDQRQGLRAPAGPQNSPLQRDGHLQRWMQNHSNLPLEQQERELQNQPGFRELPPQTQQNQLNTLRRLYYMNPQQRERILNRTEALERLAPAQRQQYRDAVQHWAMLPPPRRHMMASAVIELRELPPEQREAVLESPAYRAQFSPDERETLRTVLMAEPYPSVRSYSREPYPPLPVP